MLRQIWLAECADSPFGMVHTRLAASKRDTLSAWLTEEGWRQQELSDAVKIEEAIWRKYVHIAGREVLYMRTSVLSFIDE